MGYVVQTTLAMLLGSFCLPSLLAHAEPVRSISYRDRLYDAAGSGGNLFVVGHPGHLLRSRDGGASFEAVSAGLHDEALFSIAFNDKGQGAIVGRSGVALVSLDKGEHWSPAPVKLGEETPSLFGVDVLEDGTIVAVGEFGAIVRSEDHGKTWTRSSYSAELHGAQVPDVAAAPTAACHTVGDAETENEGAAEEARLTDVGFADATRGLVVGEFGLVLRSEDGGRTFTRQNSCVDKQLYGLSVIDAKRAIAVGAEGSAIETMDGGTTWLVRPTGTSDHLFGVRADAKRALVVGAAGIALVRKGDGSFKLADTGVHSWLASAWLDDKGHGVIVGGRAYVLRTQDGGDTQQRIFGD